MAETGKPWYLQKSVRWAHFRSMPVKRLWVLMTGVFLLFSVIGPLVDLLAYNGEMPSSHYFPSSERGANGVAGLKYHS